MTKAHPISALTVDQRTFSQPLAPRTTAVPPIIADDRGAILVVTAFMAVLLAGALFFVFGIGERLLHAERMQDAADSSALAGAVVYARFMNLTALLNIMMAVVTALAIALQIIIAAGGAIGTALTMASFFPPNPAAATAAATWGTAVFAPVLANMQAARSTTRTILVALHGTQNALKAAALPTASLRAYEIAGQLAPDGGFVLPVPTALTLPVTEVESPRRELCERATAIAVDQVFYPVEKLDPTHIFREFKSIIKPILTGGVGAASAVICSIIPNDSSAAPMKVKDGASYALGQDGLQVRGVAWAADAKRARAFRTLVGLAAANRGEPRHVPHVRVAQAEYYVEGSDALIRERRDWLWSLHWTARLRPFRLGSERGHADVTAVGTAIAGACRVGGRAGGDCGKVGADLAEVLRAAGGKAAH